MTRSTLLLIIGLLMAGTAWAHQGVKNPAVMARMEAMGRIKQATATLGKMAKGSLPHDAEKAEEARLILIRAAGNIPMRFEKNASDAKSEAMPAIWENWEDFTVRAGDMTRAAKALDVTTEATIRAGMGDWGPVVPDVTSCIG